MDGGASAAIEVLVQTLVNVFKEEISLIRGLYKDAEHLKTTLGLIQSYLNDAEKKVNTQEAVKNWLKELETLAFRSDNVFDEFNYHLLHKQMNMPKTSKVLPSFFSCFNHIARTRDVAQTIKQIDMDFKSLSQNSTVFGLEAMVVNAPAAVPDTAFETDSLTLDPIFIGRDDDVPKLVSKLTESPGEQFSIVAVVGMGGLGKTTLARKVFNHERKLIASQTSEAESTEEENNEVTGNRGASSEKFKKSFKAKTDEVEIRQEILKKLKKALKARTYLLVLDDIWNDDQKWEDFIKLRELPDGLDTLNYLEELTIGYCSNLKSIGYPSGGGQSRGQLRSLRIEMCEELIDLPREMIECLAKSARLRVLEIIGVPKVMATASVESWHLRSLRIIVIEVNSSDMEWLRESKESTVDGILEGCCHSLTELMIKGVEFWDGGIASVVGEPLISSHIGSE